MSLLPNPGLVGKTTITVGATVLLKTHLDNDLVDHDEGFSVVSSHSRIDSPEGLSNIRHSMRSMTSPVWSRIISIQSSADGLV